MISTGQAHLIASTMMATVGGIVLGLGRPKSCAGRLLRPSHLNLDTRVCSPEFCPCHWVCFTSVPKFHQLLLCPASPEG